MRLDHRIRHSAAVRVCDVASDSLALISNPLARQNVYLVSPTPHDGAAHCTRIRRPKFGEYKVSSASATTSCVSAVYALVFSYTVDNATVFLS